MVFEFLPARHLRNDFPSPREAGRATQVLAYLEAEPKAFLLVENHQKAEFLRQRLPPWDARKSRIGTQEDYERYKERNKK